MGWLWGNDDPLKDLDPSLRRYLETQAPRSTSTKPAPLPTPPPTAAPVEQKTTEPGEPVQRTWSSLFGLSTSNSYYAQPKGAPDSVVEAGDANPSDAIPKESLFQDGRYAHLWKTYRSSEQLEDAGRSDQEKLLDIVNGYKDRQADLKRMAMENCINEQLAVHDCFRYGGWTARLTMCSTQNRELERCVLMQTKFLRALGYLDLYDRPASESEKIQMHADKLYGQMKEQEKAINEAREKGLPLPDFGPMIRHKGETPASSDEYLAKPSELSFESLPQQLQSEFREKRLDGLQGIELELAKRELEQEISSQSQLFYRMNEHYRREHKERLARRGAGKERMTDKVKSVFDMRDWQKLEAVEAEREAQKRHAQLQQEQSRA